MGRKTAIMLISVFTLYHLGYYLIYASLKQQRDIFWENKLSENDFSGSEIYHRSLPISFPYQPDQENLLNLKLERHSDGGVYRILKYRYEKDTLHITYTKDVNEEDLNRSFTDWTNTFAQKPISEKGGASHVPVLEKNYLPCCDNFVLNQPTVIKFEIHPFYTRTTLSSFLEVSEPPPWNILRFC